LVNWSLQVVTAAVTVFPHTAGFGLPLTAVALTAPAPPTASVATAIPAAAFEATTAEISDRNDIKLLSFVFLSSSRRRSRCSIGLVFWIVHSRQLRSLAM
jgi:hypothetical protein